jgi:hypothetical protein
MAANNTFNRRRTFLAACAAAILLAGLALGGGRAVAPAPFVQEREEAGYRIGVEEAVSATPYARRASITADGKDQPHIATEWNDGNVNNGIYMYHRTGYAWQAQKTVLGGKYEAPVIRVDAKDRLWLSTSMVCADYPGPGSPCYTNFNDMGGRKCCNQVSQYSGASAPAAPAQAWGPVNINSGFVGVMDLDPFSPDTALHLGDFFVSFDAAGNPTKGFDPDLRAGEKMAVGVSPRAGQAGIWHAASGGSQGNPSAYTNSTMGGRKEFWADEPYLTAAGDDGSYIALGIDLVKPDAAYITGSYDGVVVNIWDGQKFVFPASNLYQVDATAASFGNGVRRFSPQWAPARNGGAYLCWTAAGNRVKVRYFTHKGSADFGPEIDLAAGSKCSLAADSKGALHLVYENGGVRYRKILPPDAGGGTGRLAACRDNPRYLQNGDGKCIFLTGAYSVGNISQGQGIWKAMLDDMAGKQNYMRLEAPFAIDYPFPQPYIRVPGSGQTSNGNDGKFDLTQFDENYWKNYRDFIAYAGQKGVYLHIALFDEIFTKYKPGCCGFGRNAFGNGNHVNAGLVGNVDRNGDLSGTGSNEFYDADALYGRTSDPQRLAVAELQRAWVDKIVTETKGFSNVFYETGNEIMPPAEWIEYWVDFIRVRTDIPMTDDRGEPFEPRTNAAHPVEGVTFHNTGLGGGDDIAKAYSAQDLQYGKILIPDTDGAAPGTAAVPEKTRQAAWITLATGGGVWADYAEAIGTNFLSGQWQLNPLLAEEMAYYGHLQNFLKMTGVQFFKMAPHDELTSRGRCLANPGSEYLVYSRTGADFTIDLTGAVGTFNVKWFNPVTGAFGGETTTTGGAPRSFSSPFGAESALYIAAQGLGKPPTFSGFSPFDTEDLDPDCTVIAADNSGTGLRASSAKYTFSTDKGVSWHVQGATGNLALGKPSDASSEYQNADRKKQYANDGDPGTGWAPLDGSTDFWWSVDLGSVQTVSRIKLVTVGTTDRGKDYHLDHWDGAAWQVIVSGVKTTTVVEHTFGPVATQKVRVYFTSTYGNEETIHEVEVYGPGGDTTVADPAGQPWYDATVDGADGAPTLNLLAPAVPFGRLSETDNLIRFRIGDLQGNMTTSPDYTVRIVAEIPDGGAATDSGGTDGAVTDDGAAAGDAGLVADGGHPGSDGGSTGGDVSGTGGADGGTGKGGGGDTETAGCSCASVGI